MSSFFRKSVPGPTTTPSPPPPPPTTEPAATDPQPTETPSSEPYWDVSYGPKDAIHTSSGPRTPLHHLPPGHPPVKPHKHEPGSFTCPYAAALGEKSDGEGAQQHPHGYCPPQAGDSRSVCPALNSMANHGYIPRDGHHITVTQLIHGLRACFNLSLPLATILSSGGYILTHRPLALLPFALPRFIRPEGKGLHLYEFCVHNGTEHDASLVHEDIDPSLRDAGPGKRQYPPFGVRDKMVEDIIGDLEPKVDKKVREAFLEAWRNPKGSGGIGGVSVDDMELLQSLTGSIVINAEDIARTRVRLEDSLPLAPAPSKTPKKSLFSLFSKKSSDNSTPLTHGTMDAIHAEVARGEVGILLALPSWQRKVLSSNIASRAAAGPAGNMSKDGVIFEWMMRFLLYETLPLEIIGGPSNSNHDEYDEKEGNGNGNGHHHRRESSSPTLWGSIRYLSKRGRPKTPQSFGPSEKSRSSTPAGLEPPSQPRASLAQWSPFLGHDPVSPPPGGISIQDKNDIAARKRSLKRVGLRDVAAQTKIMAAKMAEIRKEKGIEVMLSKPLGNGVKVNVNGSNPNGEY